MDDGPTESGDTPAEPAGTPLPAAWPTPSQRFAHTLAQKLEALSRASMERWLEEPEAVPPGLVESLDRARHLLEG
jgi:hypothetical protein